MKTIIAYYGQIGGGCLTGMLSFIWFGFTRSDESAGAIVARRCLVCLLVL
jgi:hypothetical protein